MHRFAPAKAEIIIYIYNMVKAIVSLCCAFILISGCTVIKYKLLTYRGSYVLKDRIIRTDGYYFQTSGSGYIEAYMFFPDGYVYQGSYNSHEQFREYLQKINEQKYGWGVYRIDNDTIKLQHFEARGSELQVVWEVIEIHGIVMHSEKLRLFQSQLSQKVYHFDETYSFMKLDTIPSNRNWLMDVRIKKSAQKKQRNN
jgi:hypothetical protein